VSCSVTRRKLIECLHVISRFHNEAFPISISYLHSFSFSNNKKVRKASKNILLQGTQAPGKFHGDLPWSPCDGKLRESIIVTVRGDAEVGQCEALPIVPCSSCNPIPFLPLTSPSRPAVSPIPHLQRHLPEKQNLSTRQFSPHLSLSPPFQAGNWGRGEVEELPAPLARFEIMSEGLGHW
jgi:hypothetical protein